MKKALIVSPYLDHLGGGERYMLTIASVLESLGHNITFAWDNATQIISLAKMLGIELKSPSLDPAIKQLYFARNFLSMYRATRAYDIVIYLSDGSIPLLGGRKNILHMQVPFHDVSGRSLANQFKKRTIDHVIVNSRFTKKIVDQEYGINSTVLYPPVDPITCDAPKENIILSVGRFEPSLNTKKQDVLIDAWRLLSPTLPNWRLILAGGSSSDDWLAHLRGLATGLLVDFEPNISHEGLCSLFARAKIYWHGAGYGIDESKNPELTEHFGITTVEAISAGCIPLVIPSGGQREILPDPAHHWATTQELAEKTKSVINSPSPLVFDISTYTIESFNRNLSALI